VPIAAELSSSLYTMKPINHLTNQDIVDGFVTTWFEWIRPILTIDGAVLRFVMGNFTCLLWPCFELWISIGLRTAFFGGRIFNRVNDVVFVVWVEEILNYVYCSPFFLEERHLSLLESLWPSRKTRLTSVKASETTPGGAKITKEHSLSARGMYVTDEANGPPNVMYKVFGGVRGGFV
jgi:hypothetical protein